LKAPVRGDIIRTETQAGRETILDAMRRTIGRDRLFGAGDRIVIGLSGGADSVTLSVLLPDVARESGAEVVALAHLNHGLRPGAEDDQRFCGEFAARLGLPFETETADVRALARERRTSIEDAGRIARYAFLRRVMASRDATRIAVAHNLNDQAETVLLRLCRGAGPKGLASIFPKAGPVIRPLLDVRRAAIDAFVAAEGIAFREDPTNRDLTFARNRVRHELLPYLTRHVGEGIVDVLARQAAIAREDADWLEQAATESARSLVLEEETGISVDAAGLRKLHPALARRVVHAVLMRVAHAHDDEARKGARRRRRFVGFDHVDAVLRLAGGMGTPGGPETIDLPGSRVKQDGGRLRFEPRPQDPGRAGRRRGRPGRL
jgi:tRNA(Ile)-lysidine synthase